MKELHFYEKSVYGQILIYPTKEIATSIRNLTKTKTVSISHINALRDLGFTIIVSPQRDKELKLQYHNQMGKPTPTRTTTKLKLV